MMSAEVVVSQGEITFGNELFQLRLAFDDGGLRKTGLRLLRTGTEFIKEEEGEFSFKVNDRGVDSRQVRPEGDAWYEVSEWQDGGRQLVVRFSVPESPLRGSVTYSIPAHVAGYVKHIELEAMTEEARIENFYLEKFCFCAGEFADNELLCGYERRPGPILWASEGETDVMELHNAKLQAGWLAATAAPGALRRLFWYPHWRAAGISYSMSRAPFLKYLRPGERFRAHNTYFGVYAGAGDKQLLAELVRTQLLPMTQPEGVMYCTWVPFLKNISEELVERMSREASELGFRYFVLDDGWFTADNRAVDRDKFPHGLEAVSEMVRSRGMKFGLWLSIGTSYGLNPVPEQYLARRADGRMKYFGGRPVLCWASGYRDVLVSQLTALAEKYQVSYFKLDFSSVFCPYMMMEQGCHATEHEHHRGYEDSFIEMYASLRYLREQLKQRFPQLLIDFSFEAFGTNEPNIAALEHCELHHVSNYSGEKPEMQDIRRIRDVYYRWLERLPAERILGGLLTLQNSRCQEYLLTALCGAPLVAGDLSKLTAEQKAQVRDIVAAFNRLVDEAPMRGLNVLDRQARSDGFERRNALGHGFTCQFAHAEGEEPTAGFSVLAWRNERARCGHEGCSGNVYEHGFQEGDA